MTQAPRRSPPDIRCPACGFAWGAVTTPSAPYIGLQAVRYECPNRKCTRRHWIIVYRLRLVPRLRLEVLEIVRSWGPLPDDLRRSLVGVIDDDTLEFLVAAAALTPERV